MSDMTLVGHGDTTTVILLRRELVKRKAALLRAQFEIEDLEKFLRDEIGNYVTPSPLPGSPASAYLLKKESRNFKSLQKRLLNATIEEKREIFAS